MGVTIHYRGRLKTPTLYTALLTEVKDICDINHWNYTIIPSYNRSDKALPELDESELKGISFTVAPGCEPVMFFFNNEGILRGPFSDYWKDEPLPWLFTKTQFAGPSAHILLCVFLRYIFEKYFIQSEVIDEGGYWHTGDQQSLEEKMGMINSALDRIETTVEDLKDRGYKGEALVNALMKILNNNDDTQTSLRSTSKGD